MTVFVRAPLLAGTGIAALVFWSACSMAPKTANMQASPECHVWRDGGFGTIAARVNGQSKLYGVAGSAYSAHFDGPESIAVSGTIGTMSATYSARQLVIHTGMTDIGPTTIGTGTATVRGGIAPQTFHFNERCTDRDAALGITSLVVMIIAGSGK